MAALADDAVHTEQTERNRSVRFSLPATQTRSSPEKAKDNIFSKSRGSVRLLVLGVKLLMFLVVLAALVASKISITTILAHLRSMTEYANATGNMVSSTNTVNENIAKAAGLYWQLLFILMIPNVITWVRAFFNGVIGKSASQPWPTFRATLGGIALAIFEVISVTAIFFCSLIMLPPEIALLLMNGMFSAQAVVNFVRICKYGGFSQYNCIEQPQWVPESQCYTIIASIMQVVGSLLQFGGIILAFTFFGLGLPKTNPDSIAKIIFAGAVCFLLLSICWTEKIQRLATIPNLTTLGSQFKRYAEKHKYQSTARWKANFIASSVRLLLYPFISFVVFRYTYKLKNSTITVDPWCLGHMYNVSIGQTFQWEPQEIAIFSIHITSAFLAYFISQLACYMTLHRYGLVLPVLLATPVSLIVVICMNNLDDTSLGFQMNGLVIAKNMNNAEPNLFFCLAFAFATLLWVGQIIITTYRIFITKTAILAAEEDMFVRPFYNSALLEQYLILNRDAHYRSSEVNSDDCMVIICSTMYREDTTEMRQMLKSLRRVANYYKSEHKENTPTKRAVGNFESHIFFDGGCKGDQVLPFAVQLLSLIRETLGVKLNQAKRKRTPYGCRFEWMVEPDSKLGHNGMLFAIHLKDNSKIKNKKRWSQVMYMNYVINYRAKKEGLDLDNTFILTTDADINFKAESAVVLLDMLARDFHVGAVSSRTHPKGYGPIYWYQIFDYAIGHWLQKPAEHILGCVLCCPGCFSIFRCSALQDCLTKYSEEVHSASEFLTKDMGEDRWLCTLLVENGWRLDYCAISNDETYCPVDFDEFFKQRRRWIPSTVANLQLLISSAKRITRHNMSINVLFIFYQVFIILSTVIAPSTVILIMSSALQVYGISQEAAIISLFAIGVLYGLLCLFSTQRTQLDVAKILTLVLSILMVVVVVGLIKVVVADIELLLNVTTSDRHIDPYFALPVSSTTFYIAFFAIIFPVTAVFHYREFYCLIHSVWYLLGLPGGYLILLIYSAANLNSRSWGTREKSNDETENIYTILYKSLKKSLSACMRHINHSNKQSEEMPEVECSMSQHHDEEKEAATSENVKGKVEHPDLAIALEPSDMTAAKYPWLYQWLKCHKCYQFFDNFVSGGYTKEWYVAGMSRNDLQKIGVKPEGFVRHLGKCISQLAVSPISSGIPESVEDWLSKLRMDEEEEDYIRRFNAAGYCTSDDVEHLREITEDELKVDIGVTKPGHRKRLMQAIEMLRVESKDERQIQKAKMFLTEKSHLDPLDSDETDFWTKKVSTTLRPVPEGLSQATTLKGDLNNLRNIILVSMFLINLIWVVLFLTLNFVELQALNINSQVLVIVFLAVYGIIALIQFISMLIHRFITLAHYIARLNEELPTESAIDETLSIRKSQIKSFEI